MRDAVSRNACSIYESQALVASNPQNRILSPRTLWRGEAMRLNWAAVVCAGIADWILGAVWFTCFRAPWQAGTRIPPEELQAYMAHPNFWSYIISLICSILIAYVIARELTGYETRGLLRGIGDGFLISMARAAAVSTEMVFESRPVSFIMISAAYPLLGCILMGIIVGAWKPKAKADLSSAPASP